MKQKFFDIEKKILNEIGAVLEKNSEKSEKELLKEVLLAERIFVYGAGRSGLMGKAFAMRLMQLNLKAFVVGETTTPSTSKKDLLVVISGSGKTKTVIDIASEAKEAGTRIACITTDPKSPLAKISSVLIVLKAKTKVSGKASSPLGSLFEQSTLIFLEAVVMGLARGKKNSEKNMRKKHASLE